MPNIFSSHQSSFGRDYVIIVLLHVVRCTTKRGIRCLMLAVPSPIPLWFYFEPGTFTHFVVIQATHSLWQLTHWNFTHDTLQYTPTLHLTTPQQTKPRSSRSIFGYNHSRHTCCFSSSLIKKESNMSSSLPTSSYHRLLTHHTNSFINFTYVFHSSGSHLAINLCQNQNRESCWTLAKAPFYTFH